MRYFMIVAIALYLTGCRGSVGNDDNTPPSPPKTNEIGKVPPALPNIK